MKVVSINENKRTSLDHHIKAVHGGVGEYLDVDVKGVVLAVLTADDQIIQIATSLTEIEKMGLLESAKLNFLLYEE